MDYKSTIKFKVPSLDSLQKIKDNYSIIQLKISNKLLKRYNIELDRLTTIKKDIDLCSLNNNQDHIFFLEEEIKKAAKKNKLDYLLDGFKGYRSNLRAKLKVAKKNAAKEKKLRKIKNNFKLKIANLSCEFEEIKSSINNLKFQNTSLNLPTFVAFSYSIECNYTFIAKKTEIERWTEYEERTRQVEYTKYVDRSRSVPSISGNMTTEKYTVPVTSYRNEDYTVPVSKSRKIILREKNYEYSLDTTDMSGTTKFIASSTVFKNWESYINSLTKLNFEKSELTLEKYSQLINSELLSQKESSIEINNIQKDISFKSAFKDLLKTDIEKDLERNLDNKVNAEIETFIKSSLDFNEYSDVAINYKVTDNLMNNLCIPFLSHELNYFSKKWGKNLLIQVNTLFLKEEEEYIDDSQECYKEIWQGLSNEIDSAEKILNEAKETSKLAKEPINFRPVFVIFTALIAILVLNSTISATISETRKRIQWAKCWNEYETLNIYNPQTKTYYDDVSIPMPGSSKNCRTYLPRYMRIKYGIKNRFYKN